MAHLEFTNPHLALEDGAQIAYYPNFISNTEASYLFEKFHDEETWEHRAIQVFGREVFQPRLISWAGNLPYRYSGQVLPPRKLSKRLKELKAHIENQTESVFNHVLLNYYRNGSDNMGMHSDNEPELGKNPIIAALSLGAPRRFLLKRKSAKKGESPSTIILDHGSLLVMGGSIQHTWRHGLPKAGRLMEPRINVTFRHLLGTAP